MRLRLFVSTLFVFLISCTPKSAQEIVIGFFPIEESQKTQVKVDALIQALNKKTGLKLKSWVAPDFQSLVFGVNEEKVHFAFVPPLAFLIAESKGNVQPLLTVVRGGKSYFYSVIITSKNYKSLKDLKNKTIGWADPLSASGYFVPGQMLLEEKLDPRGFFKSNFFAGGNDTLVKAVANKIVDAGATFASDPDKKIGAWNLYLKDPKQIASIKILKVSKPIPNDMFVATKAFQKENKPAVDKLTESLRKAHDDPELKKALSALYSIDSFTSPDLQKYDTFRGIVRPTAAKRK